MQTKEKKILFIGDFKWIQNRQSIEWILKDIWPEIELRLKNYEFRIKLWIVGKNVPDNVKSFAKDNIVFDEHAPEQTEKIFQQASILLAPIKVGGGTQYKILEAMASGVPVVTTTLGAEGVKCDPKKDLLIADDADTISEQVVNVLNNKEQYESLSKRGRECVEKYYSWELIAEKLDKVYSNVVSQ